MNAPQNLEIAPPSAATSALLRPRLTHVAIHVWDLAAMAAFYEGVLGVIRSDQGRGANFPVDFIFYTADPTEHHQFVLVTGRPREATFSVANQLSFLVHSLDDLRTIQARAIAHGAREFRYTTHGNAWSFYFLDPEGNRIEIYTHTPWYVPQPHGVPFDLAKSNEEIQRETEAHCRTTPGFCSREEWIARTTARLASDKPGT